MNRVLARLFGACAAMVDRGASFAQVDEALQALGLPMGPFALLGLVGLSTPAHVAGILHEAWPDRFPLDPNVAMMADCGSLDEVERRWQRDAADAGVRGAPSDDEIREGARSAVADEIRHLLADGTAPDVRDVDTCMVLGAG